MTMDLAAVQEHLARRAYRPGWSLEAYRGDTTGLVHIEITAEVENSYAPGSMVPLHIVSPVPPYALKDALALDKWISWRLQTVEIHESQEWYRRASRDGERMVPVFNPHADGADRDRWPIIRRGT
jgi:hypothetical protein